MDYYLNTQNTKNRLKKELKEHGKLILAVDFDSTIYDYHNNGHSFNNVIDLLRRWRQYSYIVIFSASPPSRYKQMQDYMYENNIPFDKINENVVDGVPKGAKIYYNALLDDRAGLREVYDILVDLIEEIEESGLN